MDASAVAERCKGHVSVYEEAQKAWQEHKWLESEKAGRDLGDEAVRHWSRSHWLRFYRLRLVQHLRGETYFREFHPRSFGIVCGHMQAPRELVDDIFDQIRDGAENLDVICWAQNHALPTDQVIEILEAIDINRQRLTPPAE